MAYVLTDPEFFPPYVLNDLAAPIKGEMIAAARRHSARRTRWELPTVDRNARRMLIGTDYGHVQSIAHAVAIIRGFLIRDEFGPESTGPGDALLSISPDQRAGFDHDYPDAAAIIRHVADWWGRTTEDPGYEDISRAREYAAWRYIGERLDSGEISAYGVTA